MEANAKLEFEFIWSEKKKSKKRSVELTNEVSENINGLFDIIHSSSLWNNEGMRNNVLKELLPKSLVELLGYDAIIRRVPITY